MFFLNRDKWNKYHFNENRFIIWMCKFLLVSIVGIKFDNKNISNKQRWGYDVHVKPTSIRKLIFNFLCYLWIVGKHVFSTLHVMISWHIPSHFTFALPSNRKVICMYYCHYTLYFKALVTNAMRRIEIITQSLSLIHIWRCRRYAVCRSRWSPYH